MKRIRRIATFIAETAIGEDSERYRNPAVRWAVQQYRLLFYTARGLVEHGTLVRSAALTFYTLMSIVPVAAVIFAVVKGFGLTETLLDNLYGIFPQHPEVIEYLIGFAERALARTQGGVVAVVALVTLFWAVIRAFASIESAFNNIWEVKTARSLTRQYSTYITIVVVVPLLWAATRALGLYVDAQLGLGSSAWSFVVSKCAVLVMTWLIFAVLYTAIPNTKVRFRSALTAGVVAGTLFMLFQWGYVYLQRWMTSYNAIYGSFAALPLFLIWMQTSWQILLFGGELSFAYQNVARFAVERESLRISYDRRRRAMLAVMVVAARRFCAAQGSTGPEEIRGQLGLPTRLVNDLLYELAKAGMLAPVASEDAEHEVRFVPARDLTSLTLCDVIDAVETQGDATFAPSRAPEIGRVNEAWSRIAACRPGQCATDRPDMNGQQNEIRSVTIVGSGNVAEALARALGDGPFELRGVLARNEARGREVARIGRTAWTDDPARLAASDLCIVAVSDRAVAEAAAALPCGVAEAVVHTAGCVPLEALPACFGARGVLYPLQTFTRGHAVELSEVPFFTEASDEAFALRLDAFARAAGGAVLRADSAQRRRIHLAGVFACNFVNAMYGAAGRVLRDADIPFDVLGPIIRETAAKAAASGDPASVQTGPAVRGDRATQERHCELLADDPELTTIYKLISEQIWRISKK